MMDKFDPIDLKILKILQENSKITNLDLSKKIGLSPAPTLERVKKLESTNVVLSYHAAVNPQEIGLNVKTFVLVSLAWQKDNALNNFLDKIKEIDEITECYIITGEADFLIKIVCKDIPTYEQLLFKISTCSAKVSIPLSTRPFSAAKRHNVSSSDNRRSLDRTLSVNILVTIIGFMVLKVVKEKPVFC